METQTLGKSKIPFGVQIIGWLCLCIAILEIFFSGLALLGITIGPVSLLHDNLGFIVLVGVPVIILGVVTFVTGLGLLKGKNWARIVVIVYLLIDIIGGIREMIEKKQWVLFPIVSILIAAYLIFNKKVKRVFTGK